MVSPFNVLLVQFQLCQLLGRFAGFHGAADDKKSYDSPLKILNLSKRLLCETAPNDEREQLNEQAQMATYMKLAKLGWRRK